MAVWLATACGLVVCGPPCAAQPWCWPPPPYVAGLGPPPLAVVETAVRPKRAEVRVDGEYVGEARDYNGRWDRLWLAPGAHVIEFALAGYQTLSRTMDLAPGAYLLLSDELQAGTGSDPRSSERAPPASTPSPVSPEARAEERATPSTTTPRGLLRLSVSPHDAVVYLDGQFLARAEELARLRGALPLAEGPHTIEAVRPGYVSREESVVIAAGEPAVVTLELERERGD